MSHVHRFTFLCLTLLGLGCAPVPIVMTHPEMPAVHATGIVILFICGKNRDMLVVYSDGTHKILSERSDDEILLIGPQIGGLNPDAWFYSHPRLCGLTPL